MSRLSVAHRAVALQVVIDLHVRPAGAGDDRLGLLLAMLGLALDQGHRLLVVAGLGMGSVGPGHSFFRH